MSARFVQSVCICCCLLCLTILISVEACCRWSFSARRRRFGGPCAASPLFSPRRHSKNVARRVVLGQQSQLDFLSKAATVNSKTALYTARYHTHEAMRLAGLANSARAYSRPSRIPHQFPTRARLPSCRHISTDHGAPKSIAKLLNWKPEVGARDVVVNGFIRSVRTMKARTFVALGDGTSLAPLQALVPSNQAEGYDQTF